MVSTGMERCDKFQEAFNEKARQVMGTGSTVRVLDHGLICDEFEDIVKYYLELDINGVPHTFFSAYSWYNAELPVEDTIEKIMDLFDVDEEEATKMLKEVSLV